MVACDRRWPETLFQLECCIGCGFPCFALRVIPGTNWDFYKKKKSSVPLFALSIIVIDHCLAALINQSARSNTSNYPISQILIEFGRRTQTKSLWSKLLSDKTIENQCQVAPNQLNDKNSTKPFRLFINEHLSSLQWLIHVFRILCYSHKLITYTFLWAIADGKIELRWFKVINQSASVCVAHCLNRGKYRSSDCYGPPIKLLLHPHTSIFQRVPHLIPSVCFQQPPLTIQLHGID